MYSRPGLDSATTSNGSAVSTPGNNNVGVTQGRLPTSDTTSVSVKPSLAKDNENVKEIILPKKQNDGNQPDRYTGEYEVKDAKFYDLIKNGNVTVNTLKSVSPAGVSNKVTQVQDTQNIPSVISIADLLTGVKDRSRKPYVNKYGGDSL